LIKKKDKDMEVVIGLESTACYHINLYSFLISQEIETLVINPLLIKNFTKMSLRKTKTDKKDAKTIASFLLIHRDSIHQMNVSEVFQDIRDLSRERATLSHQLSAVKVEIGRVLQTLFPELEKIGDLFTKVMIHFIKQYPSARIVKASTVSKIRKSLRQTSCSEKISFTAEEIMEAARSSVATVSPAKEVILLGKIETLEHLEKRGHDLDRVLTRYCESMVIEDVKILKSIKGIGNKTATTFLAELGPISNYASYKKLIAYAGIDPAVYQSGEYEGNGKISKRGNRHLRRVIWLMTVSVIQHSKWLKKYYQKKRKAGQPYKKAVIGTAHKLVRVIFSMLTHKVRFQEVKI
jgi:transposase